MRFDLVLPDRQVNVLSTRHSTRPRRLASVCAICHSHHSTFVHWCFVINVYLVFRKKDLYLIITQKLTFMKSGGFQVKSGGFHTDFIKSGRFQVKSTRFRTDFTHEIRRISKGQLPGMVSPMFSTLPGTIWTSIPSA